jgi:GTP cyclohydrolase I
LAKLSTLNRRRALPTVTPRVRPTREAAEAAVRTLLAWAGDDPAREGLHDTPRRVVDAYDEYFSGYTQDVSSVLADTFEDQRGYRDMVLLRDIRFASFCEHHVTPFLGTAHVAYVPSGRIVGLSRLAKVVEVLSRRLQTQERLTTEVADAIHLELAPRGVAVMMTAEHMCMAIRGVRACGTSTVTHAFRGVFESDIPLRDRFLAMATAPR